MSTRCNILLTDNGEDGIWLYHHCDGYPSGVGAWLTAYLNRVHPDYPPSITTLANELVKNQNNLNDDGYELTSGRHGDIDYLYHYEFKIDRTRKDANHTSVIYQASLTCHPIYPEEGEGAQVLWSMRRVWE